MVANHAHGKAFELLGTAAYHALYEFGGIVGINNPEQYEILLSDPREKKDMIKVGIMQKKGEKYTKYDGSPHQRKPDLVLEGGGDYARRWIELKSWRYNKNEPNKYLATDRTLVASLFPLWDGRSNGDDVKKYTTNAHKQSFLDLAATRDALKTEYWDRQQFGINKPSKTITWIQVWEPGKRTWRELVKENGKYKLGKKEVTVNVANPWIDGNDITKGLVTGISPQFKALQRYLTSAPDGISANAFKTSTGYTKNEYKNDYAGEQISANVTDLRNAKIRPFTLNTFFALEAGDNFGQNIKDKLIEQFGSSDFVELQKAIDKDNLTMEQIEQLKENLTERILEIIGPWKYLAVHIPLVSDVENAAVDMFTGDEIEAARKYAAEFELPESYFENACEAP